MRKPGQTVPKLRHHRATGRAVCTLNGKHIYCGKWGTPEAQAAYDELIRQFLGNHRMLPNTSGDATIAEIMEGFWTMCKYRYVKHGRPTSRQRVIWHALTPLRAEPFASKIANEFTSTDFDLLIDEYRKVRLRRDETLGLSRKVVNVKLKIVLQMFGFACGKGLVKPDVVFTLEKHFKANPLLRGRHFRETSKVRPIRSDDLEDVLEYMPEQVQALLLFQRFTGCRPGEALLLRPCDIDTSVDPWDYQPHEWKTEHHDLERHIAVNADAQAVLQPFLDACADPEAYLFSPRAAVLKQAKSRRPKLSRYGHRYTGKSYYALVRKGIDRANEARAKEGKPPVAAFGPNKIRHLVAKEIRRQYTAEDCRVILGHESPRTTEGYGDDPDYTRAREAMAKFRPV
jgi:integrase